ncbi:MAG: hypothetical protein J6V50_00535, partial [Clostridia bacterium]|nr:hypothetical protein [Clostridia bacterium]
MTLNQLFTNNMVFAANKPIRVFGEGDGTAEVTFCGNTASCESKDGKWLVQLPAMDFGGPYEMEITLNGEKTVLSEIYVGLVFLLAGQSNNQFKVRDSHKEGHLVEKNNKKRFFMLLRIEDQEDIHPEDGWVTADGDISSWPLLGSFIADEIINRKDVAIGLIGCYQGASIIEAWLPTEICDRAEFSLPIEAKTHSHINPDYATWNQNGKLYDFMFRKIVPFSVSDVVWYQGESDTTIGEAEIYDKEVAALIERWRSDLLDPALHFTVVQIANLRSQGADWAALQEAQLRVPDLVSNCDTVISKDICEDDDIHPQSKRALAVRIVDT